MAGNSSAAMFQYNPSRTGGPPDATGPTDSATERWTFEAGEECLMTAPVVVDGTVHVQINETVYALTEA